MSTQLRDISKQFEDKEFVKTYFFGVENGQDVTKKLVQDGATLNAPDLIARLIGWLEEAEPTDDAANKQAQTQQQLSSLKLNSQQEEKEESPKEPGVITGDSPNSGEESSDGDSKTTSPTTGSSGKSSSFELGRK
jgi:cell division protein FtsN